MKTAMNDPISRQAEIDAIDVLKRNYPSSCYEDLCKAVDIAIKALSAHHEIIQCKDCKYNRNPPSAGNALCDNFYGMTDQNGFCHLGERRTDEID